jgi:hypothetical protein
MKREEAKRLLALHIGDALDEMPDEVWPKDLKGLFEVAELTAEAACKALEDSALFE